MIASLKMSAIAGVGLAMLAGIATPASADRGGDIAAGIIGGAVVGTIIGSQAGPQPRRVYVDEPRSYRSGCGELRERARDAEADGRYERARHWWNRYRECRGD